MPFQSLLEGHFYSRFLRARYPYTKRYEVK